MDTYEKIGTVVDISKLIVASFTTNFPFPFPPKQIVFIFFVKFNSSYLCQNFF